jgi:CBS domain-containing protein
MTAPNLRLVQQRGERAAEKTVRKPASRKKTDTLEPEPQAPTTPIAAASALSAPKSKGSDAQARKRRKPEISARDVMSTPVHSCQPSDTLNDAAKLLWEYNLGALVVVDAEQRPISMVTDRDICFAAYTQGVALWSSHVASAMAAHVVVCNESDSVEQVRAKMREAQVRRLPVVNSTGQLVGIVGMADLCRPKSEQKASASTSPADVMQLLSAWVTPSA